LTDNLRLKPPRDTHCSKGIDVTGWNSLLRVATNNNLLFYYRLEKGKESEIARRLAPEVVVGVRFKSPDHCKAWKSNLAPMGAR
jgi:hypothetical protein